MMLTTPTTYNSSSSITPRERYIPKEIKQAISWQTDIFMIFNEIDRIFAQNHTSKLMFVKWVRANSHLKSDPRVFHLDALASGSPIHEVMDAINRTISQELDISPGCISRQIELAYHGVYSIKAAADKINSMIQYFSCKNPDQAKRELQLAIAPLKKLNPIHLQRLLFHPNLQGIPLIHYPPMAEIVLHSLGLDWQNITRLLSISCIVNHSRITSPLEIPEIFQSAMSLLLPLNIKQLCDFFTAVSAQGSNPLERSDGPAVTLIKAKCLNFTDLFAFMSLKNGNGEPLFNRLCKDFSFDLDLTPDEIMQLFRLKDSKKRTPLHHGITERSNAVVLFRKLSSEQLVELFSQRDEKGKTLFRAFQVIYFFTDLVKEKLTPTEIVKLMNSMDKDGESVLMGPQRMIDAIPLLTHLKEVYFSGVVKLLSTWFSDGHLLGRLSLFQGIEKFLDQCSSAQLYQILAIQNFQKKTLLWFFSNNSSNNQDFRFLRNMRPYFDKLDLKDKMKLFSIPDLEALRLAIKFKLIGNNLMHNEFGINFNIHSFTPIKSFTEAFDNWLTSDTQIAVGKSPLYFPLLLGLKEYVVHWLSLTTDEEREILYAQAPEWAEELKTRLLLLKHPVRQEHMSEGADMTQLPPEPLNLTFSEFFPTVLAHAKEKKYLEGSTELLLNEMSNKIIHNSQGLYFSDDPDVRRRQYDLFTNYLLHVIHNYKIGQEGGDDIVKKLILEGIGEAQRACRTRLMSQMIYFYNKSSMSSVSSYSLKDLLLQWLRIDRIHTAELRMEQVTKSEFERDNLHEQNFRLNMLEKPLHTRLGQIEDESIVFILTTYPKSEEELLAEFYKLHDCYHIVTSIKNLINANRKSKTTERERVGSLYDQVGLPMVEVENWFRSQCPSDWKTNAPLIESRETTQKESIVLLNANRKVNSFKSIYIEIEEILMGEGARQELDLKDFLERHNEFPSETTLDELQQTADELKRQHESKLKSLEAEPEIMETGEEDQEEARVCQYVKETYLDKEGCFTTEAVIAFLHNHGVLN